MTSRNQPVYRGTGSRALIQTPTTTSRYTCKSTASTQTPTTTTTNPCYTGKPTAPDPPPSEASNPSTNERAGSEYESAACEGEHENDDDNDTIDACDSAHEASPPPTRRSRRAALRAAAVAVATSKKDAAPKKVPARKATKGCKAASPATGIKAEPAIELSADPQLDLQDLARHAGAQPGMVDAATSTLPPSPAEASSIFVDGYALDVPADPVECFHAVRQQVIAAYRAVVARRGTERDLAVAMGTAAVGEGTTVAGGGGKRNAAGCEREEGRGVKRWRVKIGGSGIGGKAAEDGNGGGGGEFSGLYYISKE